MNNLLPATDLQVPEEAEQTLISNVEHVAFWEIEVIAVIMLDNICRIHCGVSDLGVLGERGQGRVEGFEKSRVMIKEQIAEYVGDPWHLLLSCFRDGVAQIDMDDNDDDSEESQ
ncbi:hypothetical protein Tco_1397571, partial [Tanacetum coccineum]